MFCPWRWTKVNLERHSVDPALTNLRHWCATATDETLYCLSLSQLFRSKQPCVTCCSRLDIRGTTYSPGMRAQACRRFFPLFLNIGFLIEGDLLCCHVRGTRTARARQTKAADGFPAPMNYFEVTETQGPLSVVHGEMKELRVNDYIKKDL